MERRQVRGTVAESSAVPEVALPNGWLRASVSDLGTVRLGRQRSRGRRDGASPTKYLRAANIGDQGLNLADVAKMDLTPYEQQVFALRTDDIVLAEGSGSPKRVGRPALWRGEIPLCC